MKNKRLILILASVPILLFIPLIAMQFSAEVVWKGSDFLIMGVLLLCTGLAIEIMLRKVRKMNHRFLLIAVIVVLLLLVIAELAVGLFGTPFAGS